MPKTIHIMKNIKFLFIAILALVASACVESEPDYKNFPSKDVDFAFAVEGDEYTTDFYYVSTMQFTNTSSKQGNVHWDFGDGTSSTEANPTHKYSKSGNYNVTLTIEGEQIGTVDLLAGSTVDRNQVLYTLARVKEFFSSTYFKVVVILTMIVVAVYLFLWVVAMLLTISRAGDPGHKPHRH